MYKTPSEVMMNLKQLQEIVISSLPAATEK